MHWQVKQKHSSSSPKAARWRLADLASHRASPEVCGKALARRNIVDRPYAFYEYVLRQSSSSGRHS
jgi:hypothetical protein